MGSDTICHILNLIYCSFFFFRLFFNPYESPSIFPLCGSIYGSHAKIFVFFRSFIPVDFTSLVQDSGQKFHVPCSVSSDRKELTHLPSSTKTQRWSYVVVGKISEVSFH